MQRKTFVAEPRLAQKLFEDPVEAHNVEYILPVELFDDVFAELLLRLPVEAVDYLLHLCLLVGGRQAL